MKPLEDERATKPEGPEQKGTRAWHVPCRFLQGAAPHSCAGDPEWPHPLRSVLRPSQANLLQRWFLDLAFTVTFMSSNLAVCLLPDMARHLPVPLPEPRATALSRH